MTASGVNWALLRLSRPLLLARASALIAIIRSPARSRTNEAESTPGNWNLARTGNIMEDNDSQLVDEDLVDEEEDKEEQHTHDNFD
jgi:hypothetical protein